MELLARSVTVKIYIQSQVMLVHDVYAAPFNVAQERLVSLNVIETFPE